MAAALGPNSIIIDMANDGTWTYSAEFLNTGLDDDRVEVEATVTDTEGSFYFTLDTALNGTGRFLHFYYRNGSEFSKVKPYLEDASGNQRIYAYRFDQFRGGNEVAYFYDIDETSAGIESEDAGFDKTNIAIIGFIGEQIGGVALRNDVIRIRDLVILDHVVITGGTSGTPLSISSFYDDYAGLMRTSLVPSPFPNRFGDPANPAEQMYVALPIHIGDNDATYFTAPDGFSVFAQPDSILADLGNVTDQSDYIGAFTITRGKKRLLLNTTVAQTLDGIVTQGYGFDNQSSGVITFINLTALDSPVNTFGTGTLAASRFSGPTGSISAESYDGVTVDASTAIYALDWANGKALQNCTFTDNTSASGALRIQESKSLTNLAFSGNTYDFFVDAPSGTITITVDSLSSTDHSGGFADAGYVAAKVNSTGATVAVVTPQPTLTVSGFPNGSKVILSQLGYTLEVVNGANPPYTYETLPTQPDEYQVQVVSSGFEDFNLPLSKSTSASAVWASSPVGSGQTVSEEKQLFMASMADDAAFTRVIGTNTMLKQQRWLDPGWVAAWNTAVVADGPSTGEIATWAGNLSSTGWTEISFNPSTGEVNA